MRLPPVLAELLNRFVAWLYAHSPTPNRYVLAGAVLLAALVAFRLVQRVVGWLLTAAVVGAALLVAYRLVAG
jgi:hypothetical protein